MSALVLSSGLDVEAAADRFARTGHVRLKPFLSPEAADALHHEARRRADWVQVVSSGDKVFELDRPTRAGMTPEQAAALDQAVIAGAREGFQFRFETLRLPDGNIAGAKRCPLGEVPRWLSAPAQQRLLRAITGAGDMALADGQATAYSPGDFLTGHDDAIAGKNRRAAYVLGLTPVWRTEWGGLLLFHGPDGAISGMTPGHNCIDIFAVPQLHSVSQVTASAGFRRYAITGWLRANP